MRDNQSPSPCHLSRDQNRSSHLLLLPSLSLSLEIIRNLSSLSSNMRMSCNGCRVLRKGCSENCSIRPCLQWIRSPDSQGNATVFLAKFYGRAGLMNLINSGPEHLRPAIFRSLLFEACGRILNPIYGSVGLLWSGNWQLCQSAVEAVLDGSPIVQMSAESAVSPSLTTTKTYDIRHVSRNENSAGMMIHKVQTRTRFKRTGGPSSTKLKQRSDSGTELTPEPTIEDSAIQLCQLRWSRNFTTNNELIRSTSHESSTSQQSELNGDGYSRENESMFSAETVEASMVSRAEPEIALKSHDNEVELELTLGLNSTRRFDSSSVKKSKNEMNGSDLETGDMEMGIDYPA